MEAEIEITPPYRRSHLDFVLPPLNSAIFGWDGGYKKIPRSVIFTLLGI
jgi:hypothetical protein